MMAFGVKRILVVAGAISILTLSYFKTQTADPARHNQIVIHLGELKQRDAMLNQDILQARTQLFHDYDPLVATVLRQRELLRDLERGPLAIYGIGQADIDRRFEAYSKLQAERAEVLERFKSKNAFLKNSLSYFPVAAAELEAKVGKVGDHEAFAGALDKLVRGILFYNLSGDGQSRSHLRSRVRNIIKTSAKLPPERRLEAQRVIAHASITLKSKGEVDGLIQELMSMPVAALGNDFYRAYTEHFRRLQESANRYRMLLYVFSVGLLGYVLYVLVKLRRTTVAVLQVNESLSERTTKLERSNAELEQFAYIASHDLQEPLRMVASYCQLLQRRYKGKLDADADDFISFAVDGATRMRELINGLLVYSRVGSQGEPFEPTSCAEALETTLLNLRGALMESGAKVTSNSLPTVTADKTQLVQLFQNLIGNAIKFGNERPVEIDVGAKRRNGEWVLNVRDNGIGIDPQYAERIFMIFQRLHGAGEYPGTGIGLAVCKKIVERHGGRIWVESEPNKGSTFYFTLPAEGGSHE